MTLHRLIHATVCLGALFAATGAPGQDLQSELGEDTPATFGVGSQTLNLGAAAFQPASSTTTYFIEEDPDEAGYLFRTGGLIDSWFAPLVLPTGAEIFQICVYGVDPFPGSGVGIRVRLEAVRLEHGGDISGVELVLPELAWDAETSDYEVFCGPIGSYTFRQRDDVDGDGNAEDLTHRIRVRLLAANEMGFGGVRINWRRQVSPAPAVPTFDDVPADHLFFEHIEALAESGITSGCDADSFCPNAPLTRGQMAAFLATALGLHWPR